MHGREEATRECWVCVGADGVPTIPRSVLRPSAALSCKCPAHFSPTISLEYTRTHAHMYSSTPFVSILHPSLCTPHRAPPHPSVVEVCVHVPPPLPPFSYALALIFKRFTESFFLLFHLFSSSLFLLFSSCLGCLTLGVNNLIPETSLNGGKLMTKGRKSCVCVCVCVCVRGRARGGALVPMVHPYTRTHLGMDCFLPPRSILANPLHERRITIPSRCASTSRTLYIVARSILLLLPPYFCPLLALRLFLFRSPASSLEYEINTPPSL